MKHIKTFSVLFCLIIVFFLKPTFSQEADIKSKKKISNSASELAPLTKKEEQKLLNLPELKLPPEYKDVVLPTVVDNSLKKYMREPFNQAGYCCGQAAGIGYNFTYEIDFKRDLAANTNETTYPTHFTWNFENEESADGRGVSYLHSFEILKKCGNPNVEDYGGTLSFGGPARWMTGYDEYYNGMHNRINKVMTIKVEDVEGLLTLKNWINDHINGSEDGGVASFYIQYTSNFNYLPSGTPEAGRCVITSWGGSPNHGMTIVGYHDSIRYDYNGDGIFTNDVDINFDGVVNLKDWEIGGFKAVNSYGGVPNWGDGGYTYMMYKTMADELGSGGIWNHSAHVLDVKENHEPQITAKVVIKHTARGTIKVTAGVASDETAEEPEYIYEYPIFDFQGNYNYMQGGNTQEEKKTIEFGLDLTPLLNYVESGEAAKYFIRVEEEDPNNWGYGTFNSFSLMDYTSGVVTEIPSPSSYVPIQHHGFTVFSVVHTVNYDDVSIDDEELPPAQINNPYNYQLSASGGTPPYHWEFNRDFEEIVSTGTFPMVNTEQLSPSSNSNGFAIKELDFSFPFYGTIHDTVLLHVDGFIPFEEDMFYHPYFYNHDIVFIHNEGIYPYLYDLTLNTSEGDGIWYEGDENSATFRWKASYADNPSGTELNFAVTLYPSGKIEYHYGAFEVPESIIWYAGTSKGDEKTYQFSKVSNDDHILINTLIEFIAPDFPYEMEISEDGVFSGVPLNAYDEKEISFRVSDNVGISSTKTLEFSTKGVIIEYTVNSGGDEIIEFGETAYLSVSVKNLEDEEITDAVLNINNSSPYIELLDDNENIGTIAVGQTVNFENAFSFYVDPLVPNKYLINITSILTSSINTWIRNNVFVAYAPVIEKQNIFVDDGNNGVLEPGDTADLIISFKNNGDVSANEILAVLSSNDPYVNINSASGNISSLAPNETGEITFNLSISEEASQNQNIDLLVDISADGGYTTQIDFSLVLGLILEDFETGDFNKLSWEHSGIENWIIDNNNPYEGEYCAQSGDINDDEESILLIELDILSDGEISFYKKVSCEDQQNGTNYDYLSFEINGFELNRWDGEIGWSLESYPVTAGPVIFKWIYHKDYSVSTGSDCAWLDNITFPACQLPSSQEIELNEGFQFVSIRIAPDDPEMTSVVAAIMNDNLNYIRNSEGEMLRKIGPNWINGIGDWITSEGYLFKMNANDLLTIEGDEIGVQTPINISSGYQFVSYFPGVPLNALNAFESILNDDLIYIRSSTGETLRKIGPVWVNGIGNTNPGEGYLFKMQGDGVLIYPEETKSALPIAKPDPVHFSFNGGNAADSVWTIYISNVSIDGFGLQTGDEIAVYDGDKLVGATALNNNILIDDQIVNEIPVFSTITSGKGFIAGNEVNFRLWDESQNIEIPLESIRFLNPYNNAYSQNTFPVEDGEYSIVDLQFNSLLSIPGNDNNSETFIQNCFPNPFSHETSVSFKINEKCFAELIIFNINGEEVIRLASSEFEPGEYKMKWDGKNKKGENISNGIYYCKLISNNSISSEKLIFIK